MEMPSQEKAMLAGNFITFLPALPYFLSITV
jgi:hypothetical protein